MICWCDRYRAAGGWTCEPCQIRAGREEIAALKQEVVRSRNEMLAEENSAIATLDRVRAAISMWRDMSDRKPPKDMGHTASAVCLTVNSVIAAFVEDLDRAISETNEHV